MAEGRLLAVRDREAVGKGDGDGDKEKLLVRERSAEEPLALDAVVVVLKRAICAGNWLVVAPEDGSGGAEACAW